MDSDSRFSISKWYLDCIADEGETFVGYAATLRWKALSLEYSSALGKRGTGPVEMKTSLHPGLLPSEAVGYVHWNCPALDIDGIWQSLERPILRTVLAGSPTPLIWSGVQPRAWAEVDAGSLGKFSGYGYVDHIEMTAVPWQLPLEELRWGRFLSASDSIIWMNFKGPFPESVAFHNGALCTRTQISDTEIVLGDQGLRLTFKDTQVLREGALVSTALSAIPGVDKLLPARMLNTHECKWRSRGVLTKNDAIKSEGWTIHEVVRWPA